MKVLFAVSNEEISESIVKKYQKEYKQIISYKNVYYFNAILKELQKDKTYDRIVISEDLEAFTHTQYDQIDKFIFEKLDSISDEAANLKGNDIPIILICSDRRTKSEEMLVKLFGIGVYNAVIGNDRSVGEVCKLINRPRSKKEAKIYYKIDSDNVNYQSENENDVSEMEIQNILAHYKRLGKDESRYVDSFNNIAAQYNDTQLRIISKFLPLNVRAVLEEKSPKYQQIMSFNTSVSNNLRRPKREEEDGPSATLLVSKTKDRIMSKPVVIPSAVNMSGSKKLTRTKKENNNNNMETKTADAEIKPIQEETNIKEEYVEEKPVIEEKVVPVKRGRGRPRKNPLPAEETTGTTKRGRGRPRKNPPPVQEETVQELPMVEESEEENILPGFEEINSLEPEKTVLSEPEETILPGFEDSMFPEQEDNKSLENFFEDNKEVSEETILPGVGYEEEEPEIPQSIYQPEIEENNQFNSFSNGYTNTPKIERMEETTVDLSQLLTPDRKIVTFVGTSKNGTSFIVNNLAQLLSSSGINTAILDTTKNRNSYYIYTKNEEELRTIATHCITNLANGFAEGISVNKNLTVYTSLPDEEDAIANVGKILETLLQKHSLILIDTDFDTPIGYFKESQETYLVQTLDVLTIQPLTAFLRDLKAKNVLDEKKLRIILNKSVRMRGITNKTIIGGMAFYNDPAMSYMTELFDRDLIKYIEIPFEEEIYTKYLQGIIECEISLKGYSKGFMQILKELGNMVYSSSNNYIPPSTDKYSSSNGFTPNMNSTLDQMKRNY